MLLVRTAGDLYFNVSPSTGPLVPFCCEAHGVFPYPAHAAFSQLSTPPSWRVWGVPFLFCIWPGNSHGFPYLSMLTPEVLFKVAWGSSPFKVIWKWNWKRDEPLSEFCPRKARPERQAPPPQPGLIHPGKRSQVGEGKGGGGRFRPRLCRQLA